MQDEECGMLNKIRTYDGKTMRHPERKLKNGETMIAMLEHSLVGRIATINQKGIPVIKPVNFLYWDRKIYIHSSTKGEKIEDLQRGSPICFEVDQPIAYVTTSEGACKASYYYRSIIIKGNANLENDPNRKKKILERLMEKYQPEGNDGEIAVEILKKTAIIEISIEEITGKENLG
jgi:nitroimidazol reductase NimA-like FMN-containing flavoprotein (pyridoxamine 5'-phosphate oxidase superfamily)